MFVYESSDCIGAAQKHIEEKTTNDGFPHGFRYESFRERLLNRSQQIPQNEETVFLDLGGSSVGVLYYEFLKYRLLRITEKKSP